MGSDRAILDNEDDIEVAARPINQEPGTAEGSLMWQSRQGESNEGNESYFEESTDNDDVVNQAMTRE